MRFRTLIFAVFAICLTLPAAWCLAEPAQPSVEALITQANAGNAEAQYGLGMVYYQGNGVPKDDAKALDLFRKAAEQGYAKAQGQLGRMYHNGEGVSKDFTEALKWYRKGVEQGDATAQSGLGFAYNNGDGVPTDYVEAVSWFRKAAEQGLARAQNNLGSMYEKGNGVPQDTTEAVDWYRKAAEQGLARAQTNLGFMYETGNGVPQDTTEAVNWFRKAAEQGDARAMDWLLNAAEQGNADEVDWFRKAAEQGNAAAQYRLGMMYYEGKGVTKDETVGIDWLGKAAEQGYADAFARLKESWNNDAVEYRLGMMYLDGKGVPQDKAKAVYQLNRAANGGSVRAQNKLILMYNNGEVVLEDAADSVDWLLKAAERGNAEAVEVLRKAAEHGNTAAQETLGMIYFKGYGVTKDDDKAITLWCTTGLAIEQQQIPNNIVIKKMFIGMSIEDACKIANKLWEGQQFSPYKVVKAEKGDLSFREGDFSLRNINRNSSAIFVAADQYGQVNKIQFSDELFNAVDMTPSDFAQAIIDNYGIPGMVMKPFTFNIFSGWEFLSPEGFRMRIFSTKSIELVRTTKMTDRKFD